jgi:hypothetical protein
MKKLLFLGLLLVSGPLHAAIAFVQGKSCHITSTATSGFISTCQFTSQVGPGNLIVVACAAGNALGSNVTVTDDQGDPFTLVNGTVTTSAPSGGTLVWGIWYAYNVKGDFTTVSCSDPNNAATAFEQSIHEYSGAASATDPFDVTSSSNSIGFASTTTVVSGYVTTSANSALMFAFAPKMPAAPTAANGTFRTNDVDNAFWATEDAIIPVAGVYQSSFTFPINVTANWMNQVSFKPPNPPARGVHSWR